MDPDRERWRSLVVDVPDWPRPGVGFKDLTPLLGDGPALAGVVTAMGQGRRGGVDAVAGVEARGFVLGAALALHLGTGFVPLRKHGKLPRAALTVAYALEYGEDRLQVHEDAVRPGQRVLVVDDVLATGGTAAASVRLVREAGAEGVGLSVLVELTALGGRAAVLAAAPGLAVEALLVW